MRRIIMIAAHALSAMTAVFFAASLLITYRSYNQDPVFEFTRHGMLWEVDCHDGVLSLDNQLQVLKEAAAFDARTEYLQEGLHQAWGTAEWRVRLDYYQKLQREEAAVAMPAVAHRVAMLPVVLLSAALTMVWVVLGLGHYPKQRRRLARVAFAGSGALALLICIASIGMAIRSRFTVDMVGKPTRWHYYKGVFGQGGATLQSFHLMRRTQSVLQTYPSMSAQARALQAQLISQAQLASKQQQQLDSKQQLAIRQRLAMLQQMPQVIITPVSSYSDAPIPYADSEFARQRETVADFKAGRWGAWKWREIEVTPRLSLAQLTWESGEPPRYWPWVSTLSEQFGSRILGAPARPPQRQEETWLIGHTLWIPYWVLIGASGAWAWIVIRRLFKLRRASRRTLQTRCPECGYDIRATPERCPECGSAVQGQF